MLSSPLAQENSFSDDTQSLTDVMSRVVRNVVRLVIGTISFPAFVDILRTVYVEEAEKKLRRDGQRPTKSALALLTGLDTRVVSAVQKTSRSLDQPPTNAVPESALVEMWWKDEFFQDPKTGQPAVLPIEGRGKTFQGLVLKSVGRNITVKTVMDRLLQSETVEIVKDDVPKVELKELYYMPISSDRARLTEIAFLESSRVLSAVIHNMSSEPEYRVPQQGRWTYRLNPSNFKEFRKRARDLLNRQISEGESLLEEFEEEKKADDQITVGFGWYQWGGHESDQ